MPSAAARAGLPCVAWPYGGRCRGAQKDEILVLYVPTQKVEVNAWNSTDEFCQKGQCPPHRGTTAAEGHEGVPGEACVDLGQPPPFPVLRREPGAACEVAKWRGNGDGRLPPSRIVDDKYK